MFEWVTGSNDEQAASGCRCEATLDGATLSVDADDCPDDGRLAATPDCMATVVRALGGEPIDAVVTTSDGVERAYLDDDAALLLAAGRFANRVAPLDERLAARAHREPLAAAREAVGRAGAVADTAAETGLAVVGTETDGLEPYVGPTVSDARIAAEPPSDG